MSIRIKKDYGLIVHTNFYAIRADCKDKFASVLFDLNLETFVRFNKTKSTCLDLVFSNNDSMLTNVKMCDTFPIFLEDIHIELDIAVSGQNSTKAFFV